MLRKHKGRFVPVLGIVRGGKPSQAAALVAACLNAGLTWLEFTMNTPEAPSMIREAIDMAGDRMVVGAGTVLTRDDLDAALEAGARFIVSPVCDPAILDLCTKYDVPVVPGALTPQDILRAWQAGAHMVKLFPARAVGPAYVKDILGPFPDIKILACGGVTEDNITDYFNAGAAAVAFGESIFRKDWMDKGAFDRMEESIRRLLDRVPAGAVHRTEGGSHEK